MNEINDHFFNYFDERLKFIEENCLDKIEGLILMCCCLEALAHYCYGIKGKNFSTFKKFVFEYSGQESIWNKISLPLLKEYFEKNGNPKYAEFIRKMGVAEKSYFLKGYNVDIPLEELEKKGKNYVITPFSDKLKSQILKFEYIKILWDKYRNYAIHEMRSNPDEAANIFNEQSYVYYNHETKMDENFKPIKTRIILGFPRPFIFSTLKCCLDNYKIYIRENNINILY